MYYTYISANFNLKCIGQQLGSKQTIFFGVHIASSITMHFCQRGITQCTFFWLCEGENFFRGPCKIFPKCCRSENNIIESILTKIKNKTKKSKCSQMFKMTCKFNVGNRMATKAIFFKYKWNTIQIIEKKNEGKILTSLYYLSMPEHCNPIFQFQ